MIQLFNMNGITSAMILETVGQAIATPDFGDGANRFSFVSDNIVLLSVDVKERVKRTVAVLKARGTGQNLGGRVAACCQGLGRCLFWVPESVRVHKKWQRVFLAFFDFATRGI